MAGARKYQAPEFLSSVITQLGYEKWLRAKSLAHIRRDKKRGNSRVSNESYKIAIHKAVVLSEGRDQYTGEMLHWRLLGQYRNAESKAGRRRYKAKFALLPTVDHVGDGLGLADFVICAWQTNDAKSDLTKEEFINLCRKVVEHSITSS